MSGDQDFVIRTVGDSALEISWPETMNDIFIARHGAALAIRNHYTTQAAVNEGFDSVMVLFLNPDLDIQEESVTIKTLLLNTETEEKLRFYQWYLPVFYDLEGEDMHAISAQTGMAVSEIVDLHSAQEYRVEFIGFLPGFPYLSGLSKKLQVPRKKNPSPAIPAGSLAIAAGQCGIYPQQSPGGWYVLGKCPLPLFSVQNDPPCFLEVGDTVNFRPIDRAALKTIEAAAFDPKDYLDG